MILELMLSGAGGVEVCRQLRTFTDAYVIMLTAQAEEDEVEVPPGIPADADLGKARSPGWKQATPAQQGHREGDKRRGH